MSHYTLNSLLNPRETMMFSNCASLFRYNNLTSRYSKMWMELIQLLRLHFYCAKNYINRMLKFVYSILLNTPFLNNTIQLFFPSSMNILLHPPCSGMRVCRLNLPQLKQRPDSYLALVERIGRLSNLLILTIQTWFLTNNEIKDVERN